MSKNDIASHQPNPVPQEETSMIKAENVTMVFNMASERLNSLKEYAIKLVRRELFFEELIALDDVSVDVKKGDVFGIIGTNGSGKSTLLKIIAGVLTPTKGTVEINGNIAPLIELGAGFDMDLSARENIYLNGALLGYSKKFIDQHFDDIVEFAEIEKFLDMPLKNYSSGMVARIAFSIATVIIPEILIVDEVLSVGDFMFQKKCEDRILDLIENHGVTVLIVSHSNDQIGRLCNKAIWIEKGKTVIEGDAQRVVRIYNGLGGRSGDREAYDRVFGALVDSAADKNGLDTSFLILERSHDKYSLELVKRGWDKIDIDAIVLVGEATHANAVVGAPLAGAQNAPIILVKAEGPTNALMNFIQEKKPSKIITIDIDDSSSETFDALSKFDWEPEIINFRGGIFEVPQQIFEYGLQNALWDSTAALVSFSNSLDTLAGSAIAYDKHYPVFFSSADITENDALLSSLAQNGFTELLLIDSNPQSLGENHHGLSLQRFDEANPDEMSRSMARFAFESGQDGFDVFLTAPNQAQWPFLMSAGCIAPHEQMVILLIDETNLESIARTLDFLKRHQSKIRNVFALGTELGSSGFPSNVYLHELKASV